MAISGATKGKLGVAGSVAINVSSTNTEAVLLDGATVTAQDGTADADSNVGAVNLTALGTSESIVTGMASTKGSHVGVGASFGINVMENDTRAEMQDGSTLAGASD